jgi:hypothetical protein
VGGGGGGGGGWVGDGGGWVVLVLLVLVLLLLLLLLLTMDTHNDHFGDVEQILEPSSCRYKLTFTLHITCKHTCLSKVLRARRRPSADR